MYAAIRQAKAKSGSAEELARRIKDGAVPIISDVDGFRAYYVVYAGDDTVTAISIFDKFERVSPSSLRGAKRRSNPGCHCGDSLDCFASLAMTKG